MSTSNISIYLHVITLANHVSILSWSVHCKSLARLWKHWRNGWLIMAEAAFQWLVCLGHFTSTRLPLCHRFPPSVLTKKIYECAKCQAQTWWQWKSWRWKKPGSRIINIKIELDPPKFNIEPQNEGGWKMMFLFKGVIFRFHVSFRWCIYIFIHFLQGLESSGRPQHIFFTILNWIMLWWERSFMRPTH